MEGIKEGVDLRNGPYMRIISSDLEFIQSGKLKDPLTFCNAPATVPTQKNNSTYCRIKMFLLIYYFTMHTFI